MKKLLLLLGALVLVAFVPVAATTGGSDNAVPPASADEHDGQASDCPDQFRQSAVDSTNTLHRVFVDGLTGTPDEQAEQLLIRMGHDARTLSLFAAAFFDEDSQWESLVEDGCLNEQGRTLYHQVEGVVRSATLSEGEAPATGYNSGMTADGPVIASEPGITGNRDALILKFVDGREVYVLQRCGNVVFAKPPKVVPEGPTDQPPPDEPPTEPPPTEPPPTEPPPTEPPPTEPPPTEPPPEDEDDKDPCLGVNRPDGECETDSEVPDQVTGPGTTCPGCDPGPPDPPEDHDRSDPDIQEDGCRGECPDAEPANPEPDPERTPDSTESPPPADEPAEEGDLESCGPNADQSCGYEQPNSADGSPPEDDNSSGGGEAGVVDEPDSSAPDNPEHDPESEEDQPSPGTSEDTSDPDMDTDASQDEDEANDSSGDNPF